MTEIQPQANAQLAQALILINQLQIKAFSSPNQAALSFIIVNDTHQVFRYDRAILWEINEKVPSIVAISGQHTLYKETEFSQKSKRLIAHLKNPNVSQELTEDSFSAESNLLSEIRSKPETRIFWQPLIHNHHQVALWFEIWDSKNRDPKKELEFLTHTLLPAYASTWVKFEKTQFLKPHFKKKKLWYYVGLPLLLMLFLVRIPLRVAAPCEIVPEKPFIVAAPLDGIIAEVNVKPGQEVRNGDLLFRYDKSVPLEQLKSAAKQVDIAKAEVERAATVGLQEPKSLAELEILKPKLQKDQIALELAQTQVAKLDVKTTEPGIVMIDDPEEWRGKPVKIGEKVLTLSNPLKTKVRIWVPEGDNVVIDPNKDINVILNVSPERELRARLDFIAFESRIGEGDVPAFLAEALWTTPPKDVKLGLKGTAILYGENVSLFYFFMRKPLAAFRRLTGF